MAPGWKRAAKQRQGVCDEGVDTVSARSALVATGRGGEAGTVPYEVAAEGLLRNEAVPGVGAEVLRSSC